jgi:hypothetical protein
MVNDNKRGSHKSRDGERAADLFESEVVTSEMVPPTGTQNMPPDPFDPAELAKLRLSQDFAGMAQVKPVLTNVAVRKPHKQEFIRVRPGEANRFDTGCFIDKESREAYMVSPAVWELLVGDVTPTLLVVCISRNSPVPFLWPLTLPATDGRPNRWHESALEAASIAENQWLKVVADMSAGCYVPMVACGNLPEPDWSDVPTMPEMLKLGFKGRFINSAEHPVLKRLRGEQ